MKMKFNEIIKDSHFIDFVRTGIKNIQISRIERPAPKPGFYYKKDWYDRMSDANQLNTEFFITNIENIWLKKSKLNAETRYIIKYVCDKSLQHMVLFYDKQKKENPVQEIKHQE